MCSFTFITWSTVAGLVSFLGSFILLSEDVAVRRLVESRGMDEADARRRMSAQVPRAERLAAADVVIDNSESLADLRHRVGEVCARLIADR